MVEVPMKEPSKRAGGVFLYALMAILGVVTANALTATSFLSGANAAWGRLIVGAVIFAIPIFAVKGNQGFEGLIRMYLGVTGLTVLLRGILDAAPLGLTGIGSSLPISVQQVI